MIGGNQPIYILREGTEREQGKDAQSNNIQAAIAIADAVKSTLGPKGMDKLLVNSMGDIVITNDGATILKEIDIDHPAAKMIINVSKSQDEECGDGTTSVVVLTGELLKKARDLIDKKIHPTTIVEGYKIASEEARRQLLSLSTKIDINNKDILHNIAMTSMASKGAKSEKDILSKIIVDALLKIKDNGNVDIDNINIIKVTGSDISNTECMDGIIIGKERSHENMPKTIDGAKILLLNIPLETKKTEVEAKIQITNPNQLTDFLDQEEEVLREMADKIKDLGCNVVFNIKPIDDIVLYYLAKYGIYAIRRTDKKDMKILSKATGGKIVMNLDDVQTGDFGYADTVYEHKINDVTMTYVEGCNNPKALSILIRGTTLQVTEELERALHDALSVVKLAIEGKELIPGGGAINIELAQYLRNMAPTVGGRQQMAIEAYAEALEIIPQTLAENAGLDPIDILLSLRSIHKKGNTDYGININTGEIENMLNMHIVEPMKLLDKELESATEASSMILRIDDIIASKKTEMPQQPPQNPYM